MDDYARSILGPNERILYETQLSAFNYIPAFLEILACGIAGVFAHIYIGNISPWIIAACVAAISIIIIFMPWLERNSSEFVITNKRLIFKTGVISRNVFEIRLSKIESVDLEQGILGRILGYGNISVHGTGDTKKTFRMIDQPVEFRRQINMAEETARGGSND